MNKSLLNNIKSNFKDMAYFEDKVEKQINEGFTNGKQLERLKKDNRYKSKILLSFLSEVNKEVLGNHAFNSYLKINKKNL